MLDPWGDQAGETATDQQEDWADFASSDPNNGKKSFDDDFSRRKNFRKLPDSSEYLSLLGKTGIVHGSTDRFTRTSIYLRLSEVRR